MSSLRNIDQEYHRLGNRAAAIAKCMGKPEKFDQVKVYVSYLALRAAQLQGYGLDCDPEDTCQKSREAIAILSTDHPAYASILQNFSVLLMIVYKLNGKPEDLEEALKIGEELVVKWKHGSLTPLVNLADMLELRFELHGKLEDLERAIGLLYLSDLDMRLITQEDMDAVLSLASKLELHYAKTKAEEPLEISVQLRKWIDCRKSISETDIEKRAVTCGARMARKEAAFSSFMKEIDVDITSFSDMLDFHKKVERAKSRHGEDMKRRMDEYSNMVLDQATENLRKLFDHPILRPNTPQQQLPGRRKTLFYAPLPTATSIRLLRFSTPLSTGGIGSKVCRCTMVTHDLRDHAGYQALSYTWGDPKILHSSLEDATAQASWNAPVFEFECDGQPVSVNSNLHSALLWITRLLQNGMELMPKTQPDAEPSSCYFWVDALCINQSDIDERNDQVQLMRRIYKQADSVMIWLGGLDFNSYGNLKRSMQAIAAVAMDNVVEKARGLLITDRESYGALNMPYISVDQWMTIYELLNRAWFTRAWVIQEAVYSQRALMLCGRWGFPIGLFARVTSFLRQTRWIYQLVDLAAPRIQKLFPDSTFRVSQSCLSYYEREKLETAEQVQLYQAKRTNSVDYFILERIMDMREALGIRDNHFVKVKGISTLPPLKNILSWFQNTESSEPKDKIYAFLGLAKEFLVEIPSNKPLQGMIIPNYRETIQNVYIEAAIFILLNDKDIGLLSLRQDATSTKVKDLPSWVPDFSVGSFPYPLDDGLAVPWTASLGLGQRKIQILPNRTLQLHGVRVDKVVQVAEWKYFTLAPFLDILMNVQQESEIKDPLMNEQLEKFSVRADIRMMGSGSKARIDESRACGTPRSQSRFEILWRTLIEDCFERVHPAPQDCGKAMKLLFTREVNELQFLAARSLLGGEQARSESAFRNACENYTAMLKIQGLVEPESRLCQPPGWNKVLSGINLALSNGTSKKLLETLSRRFHALEDSAAEKVGKGVLVELHLQTNLRNNGRSLFRSSQGRLGKGSQSTEPGDEIWLLCGASVPYILRPQKDSKYTLVGEGYVHGIMHGEAVVPSLQYNSPVDVYLI